VRQEWLGKFPEERREALIELFSIFHGPPIDVEPLIARPPIDPEEERDRGFTDGQAFDARSFKEFLAQARSVRATEETSIPYFHGYLQV
jgi:hypothetical protein